MAAAKKAEREKALADLTDEEIRLKYDPVMVALSKAEAAHCLLVANQDGLFDTDETAEWVEAFATDALREALGAAKAAYVKAVRDKLAPAAEAAG